MAGAVSVRSAGAVFASRLVAELQKRGGQPVAVVETAPPLARVLADRVGVGAKHLAHSKAKQIGGTAAARLSNSLHRKRKRLVEEQQDDATVEDGPQDLDSKVAAAGRKRVQVDPVQAAVTEGRAGKRKRSKKVKKTADAATLLPATEGSGSCVDGAPSAREALAEQFAEVACVSDSDFASNWDVPTSQAAHVPHTTTGDAKAAEKQYLSTQDSLVAPPSGLTGLRVAGNVPLSPAKHIVDLAQQVDKQALTLSEALIRVSGVAVAGDENAATCASLLIRIENGELNILQALQLAASTTHGRTVRPRAKKRSRQKNLRRDTRPDHLKPTYLTPGAPLFKPATPKWKARKGGAKAAEPADSKTVQ